MELRAHGWAPVCCGRDNERVADRERRYRSRRRSRAWSCAPVAGRRSVAAAVVSENASGAQPAGARVGGEHQVPGHGAMHGKQARMGKCDGAVGVG
jgi:hypothetical protein